MNFSLVIHVCLTLFFSSSKQWFLVIRNEENLCQVSNEKIDKLLPGKIEDEISKEQHGK